MDNFNKKEHFIFIKRDWFKFDTLPKKYLNYWKTIFEDIEEYDDDIRITIWRFDDNELYDISAYTDNNYIGAVICLNEPIYFNNNDIYTANKKTPFKDFIKVIDEFNHVNSHLENMCINHEYCKQNYEKYQQMLKDEEIEDDIEKYEKILKENDRENNVTIVILPDMNKNSIYIYMKTSPLLKEELKFITYNSKNNTKNALIKLVFYLLIDKHPLDDDFEEEWLFEIQKFDRTFTNIITMKINDQKHNWKEISFSELNELSNKGMKPSTYILSEADYEGYITDD